MDTAGPIMDPRMGMNPLRMNAINKPVPELPREAREGLGVGLASGLGQKEVMDGESFHDAQQDREGIAEVEREEKRVSRFSADTRSSGRTEEGSQGTGGRLMGAGAGAGRGLGSGL